MWVGVRRGGDRSSLGVGDWKAGLFKEARPGLMGRNMYRQRERAMHSINVSFTLFKESPFVSPESVQEFRIHFPKTFHYLTLYNFFFR